MVHGHLLTSVGKKMISNEAKWRERYLMMNLAGDMIFNNFPWYS